MTADFYRRYLRIDDRTLLNELSGISKIEYFRKGEKIINAGEEQHKIFLLKDGIVRGYLINPEGRDFTDCFGFQPGSPVMGCTRLDLPAQLNIQALNRVSVLSIPVGDFWDLADVYPEVVKIYNDYLIRSLEEHFEYGIVRSTLNAGEKYSWFAVRYPYLLERVSHKHIASFLGMTPQTFSKERTKFLREKAAAE